MDVYDFRHKVLYFPLWFVFLRYPKSVFPQVGSSHDFPVGSYCQFSRVNKSPGPLIGQTSLYLYTSKRRFVLFCFVDQINSYTFYNKYPYTFSTTLYTFVNCYPCLIRSVYFFTSLTITVLLFLDIFFPPYQYRRKRVTTCYKGSSITTLSLLTKLVLHHRTTVPSVVNHSFILHIIYPLGTGVYDTVLQSSNTVFSYSVLYGHI